MGRLAETPFAPNTLWDWSDKKINNMKEMDEDLQQMTREQLISEVEKLRNAIRKHRDCSEHDLCWFHPDLWNLLPEKYEVDISVPQWDKFMQGCIQYRKSLDKQLPNAPRTSTDFDNED
ncbi:hypothetical protein [Capnocytophaga cynodegmi]|uniref:hypothetical protein n=1 Tax=Capnocytophaga cynodegmi TaxID=28189 RepID=UPI00385A76CD